VLNTVEPERLSSTSYVIFTCHRLHCTRTDSVDRSINQSSLPSFRHTHTDHHAFIVVVFVIRNQYKEILRWLHTVNEVKSENIIITVLLVCVLAVTGRHSSLIYVCEWFDTVDYVTGKPSVKHFCHLSTALLKQTEQTQDRLDNTSAAGGQPYNDKIGALLAWQSSLMWKLMIEDRGWKLQFTR